MVAAHPSWSARQRPTGGDRNARVSGEIRQIAVCNQLEPGPRVLLDHVVRGPPTHAEKNSRRKTRKNTEWLSPVFSCSNSFAARTREGDRERAARWGMLKGPRRAKERSARGRKRAPEGSRGKATASAQRGGEC